jgi:aminoglycoside 6'-N-acetyltransferase
MAFTPIVTERLTLRAMTPADAPALAERRSDPETAEYQSWTVPYPLERAERLIAEVMERDGPTPGSWFQAAITLTDTGETVGDVVAFLTPNGRTAEIGYTLDASARGRGYATEAAAAMIDHLVDITGVHRIEASTHPDNVASNRVLERLGFTLEGVKRESYWVEDIVTDDAIWGLLARDWRA